MTPEELVRALCARHSLSPDAGTPFLPLVREALAARPEARDRLLSVVDRNLAELARRPSEPAAPISGDESVLRAVARVLHNWTPSEAMLDLGSSLDRRPGENA